MKRRDFLSYAAVVSAAASAGVACARGQGGEQATSGTHDLVLKNGRVFDGAGNPWFKADIGLKDGRINKIGRVDEQHADRVIDVDGLFVSPGFIDIHSHSDTSMFVDPWMESKIRQGITTEVNGNCGGSPAPLNEKLKARVGRRLPEEDIDWSTMGGYLDRLEQHGIARIRPESCRKRNGVTSE